LFGPLFVATQDTAAVARLHELELLPEEWRLKFVAEVEEASSLPTKGCNLGLMGTIGTAQESTDQLFLKGSTKPEKGIIMVERESE
jgi:hypothetical protein